jgi:hypothetical protein
MQKLLIFRFKQRFYFRISLGAFHLKSPTGGCAYGISSQLATPLIKKPCEMPEVVEIFNSSANIAYWRVIKAIKIYKFHIFY